MQVTSADSCRTRKTEDVETVDLVCVSGLLRIGVILSYSLCGVLLEEGHWQRGVGCVGSQSRYLTAREPPWEQNELPPIVNIMHIAHG